MLKKTCDIVEKLQLALGVAALMLYIFCTAYQVVARWTPNMTAEFTEEIANYSFIWSAFMGSAIMLRHNKHFCFNSFSSKLKGKAHFINEMAVMLLLLAFSFMMLFYGVQLTEKFWNWKLSSLPWISLGIPWLCMPVAGFTTTLYCVEAIVNFIKDPTSRKTEEEEELEKLEKEMRMEEAKKGAQSC